MSVDTHRPAHRWRFNRFGGFDQVMIDSGEDIRHLPELDPRLWAVLSCPTQGLEFDRHTLDLLDRDGDGRICIDDIKESVRWTCRRLKDPGDLFKHEAGLPLDAIDDGTEEGRLILASAWRILDNLGRTESTLITADETANTAQIFAGSRFNGDGVVQPSAARDESVAQAISDIMRCVGSRPDRSGEEGIDRELCARFFAEAREYLEWWAQAEADAINILPLGEDTESAAELFESVKTKIDDYFTRARLADYDQRAAERLNPSAADYAALANQTLSSSTESLAGFPLARVEPGRPLPLRQGVNPRWARELDAFRTRVVVPLLGDIECLTEAQWLDLSARFEAHAVWRAHRRGALVAPLGATRLRALVEGPLQAAIADLIEQDLELAGVSDAIDSVDRLVHYYQHLEPLLQNFVSLRDFYTPGRKAVFQAGTLYLDGYACDLCVRVDDLERHAALAQFSQIYLVYCDCRRRLPAGGGTETLTIVAALTAGEGGRLAVGHHGIFYDRDGADWDATVVKLIEQPLSVWRAFWSPYRGLVRLIAQTMEGVTAEVRPALAEGSRRTDPPARCTRSGVWIGGVLLVGVVGAISLATVGMGLVYEWRVLVGLLGLMGAISGPSVLLAHLRLRQRTLNPLLEANGWAVNAQARISARFGATLTRMAPWPKGAVRSLRDPCADKRCPWMTDLVLLVLLAGLILVWCNGDLADWIDRLMPQPGTEMPAVEPAAPLAEVGEPATETRLPARSAQAPDAADGPVPETAD